MQTGSDGLKVSGLSAALGVAVFLVCLSSANAPAKAQSGWFDRVSRAAGEFAGRLVEPLRPERRRRASPRRRAPAPRVDAPPPGLKPALETEPGGESAAELALSAPERAGPRTGLRSPLLDQALLPVEASGTSFRPRRVSPVPPAPEAFAARPERKPPPPGETVLAPNGVATGPAPARVAPRDEPRSASVAPRRPAPVPKPEAVLRRGDARLVPSRRNAGFAPAGIVAPPPGQKPEIPPEERLRLAALPPANSMVCTGDTPIAASFKQIPPISGRGVCGATHPVKLSAFGAAAITVSPGATVNCGMTAALARWADKVVAPAARRHLGARVVSVRNMASYVCRTRNNRPGARISEHAKANALDIGAFNLSDGRSVTVAGAWRKGGAEQAFIREVHKRSCGVFKTVLGPNADSHHHNHFHLDLAKRRSTYCR